MQLIERSRFRRAAVRVGLIWLLGSVALATAGPFGTFDGMEPHMRYCYWCVVVAVSLLVAISLRQLVVRHFARCTRVEQDILLAIAFGLLFSPLLYVFSGWMAGDEELGMSFGEMALVVVAVPLGMTFVREALVALGDRGAQPVRLAERLPDPYRGPIRAVSGRDHYVEVLTGAGQVEVLLRFSDALRELEGTDGMQVHRSHWVARTEAVGLEREGSRTFLRLTCGRRLPVSRTYRDEVVKRWALDRELGAFGGAWEPPPRAVPSELPRHPAP